MKFKSALGFFLIAIKSCLIAGCGPPSELSDFVAAAGGTIEKNENGTYWVFLQKTELTDEQFSELLELKSASQITKFNLYGTKITDTGFESIADHQQITRLDCRDLNISDQTVSRLAELPNLRSLALSGTRITGASIATLAGMTQLEFLSVGSTEITVNELLTLRRSLPKCNVVGNEFRDLLNRK